MYNLTKSNYNKLPISAGVFDGTLIGSNPPIRQINVASVERTAQGLYTVNFTNPLPTSDYILVFGAEGTSRFGDYLTKSTTGFTMEIRDGAGFLQDSNDVSFLIILGF